MQTGGGAMWIEHWRTQTDYRRFANEYWNCLMSCSWCNRARSTTPVEVSGARLLNPLLEPWAKHFVLNGSRFEAKPGDADAALTLETFALNDHRKVSARESRAEFYEDRLTLLTEAPALVHKALTLAAAEAPSSEKFAFFVDIADTLRNSARTYQKDLKRFAAVPPSAPTGCFCRPTPLLSLPPQIESQLIDLPDSL